MKISGGGLPQTELDKFAVVTSYWDTTTQEIPEVLSPQVLQTSLKKKLVKVRTDFQDEASRIT